MIRGRQTLTLGVDVRHMPLNLIDGFGGLMGQVNFTGADTASNPAEADNGDAPLASCHTPRGSLQTAALCRSYSPLGGLALRGAKLGLEPTARTRAA
jgi:hypothetical protein